MSTHHVSGRHCGAILVAVAGLVAGGVDVATAHELPNSKAPAPGTDRAGTEPTCHAWVFATHRANGKAGEKRTHDVTIKALARGCSAIPEPLRRAAGEADKMKDRTERAAILGSAASASLGEGCAIADPLVNAVTVARTCPLPSLPSTFHFRLEEGELVRLGAVDYLILNVMLRSFIAVGELDESARVLTLEFALSAEINGDDSEKREERRHNGAR